MIVHITFNDQASPAQFWQRKLSLARMFQGFTHHSVGVWDLDANSDDKNSDDRDSAKTTFVLDLQDDSVTPFGYLVPLFLAFYRHLYNAEISLPNEQARVYSDPNATLSV